MGFSEKQRTIKRETVFFGRALQSGRESRVVVRPASVDTGIVFARADIDSKPASRLGEAGLSRKLGRRSAIRAGRYTIQTIEHFLAALSALGIDNVFVDVYGEELPALDGSAVKYFRSLKDAGICDLEKPKRVIKIEETITLSGKNGAELTIEPADEFSVSYLIDYPCRSIGREELSFTINEDVFEKEIAPARTFCLKKEVEILLKAGLGGGATKENTLIMDEEGPIGTALRFPNEPLRHKILDLIGDFYLLGIPIIGKVKAKKSGHSLNGTMIETIRERYMGAVPKTGLIEKIKKFFVKSNEGR
ncbi:MAG TPA: UDP-3-O-acyl-N-acetylglucosamine deacetylase [Candidatus Omnitrophota bacterium]|mgnify:CR=1 FL=1|nr:UDP-3-O-acyl-N-acetylglucosamine deacetylase [Candidatus Omnitrophota bacterium]HPS20672.1 UDP-3-O-acyl-N-acetylglucosamine deacetylase [Candidatus Omnitrophota bacterium]